MLRAMRREIRRSGRFGLSKRPVHSIRTQCAAAVLAGIATSGNLSSQEVVVPDTLSGVVLAADSTPIASATVRATALDGSQATVTTDLSGRYVLVVESSGRSYALQASAFGYLSFATAVDVDPHTRRTVRDFRLNPRPVLLEPVQAVATAPAESDRRTPAELGQRWQSFLLDQLPLDVGDLASIASIVPGAVPGPEGLSLAGQSPEQNQITLDGASYRGGNLPSEGVRHVAVLGSTYDVARGQFSGGLIAATSIGGTNRWGAVGTLKVDDPALRYGAAPPGSRGDAAGRFQRFSTGGGGPLVRDRVFAYAALDVQRISTGTPGLDELGQGALRRLPLAPDSAARFLQILSRLGAVADTRPPSRSASDAFNGFARLDWVLPRRGALTGRVDARGSDRSGIGAAPFRLSGRTGHLRSRDLGVFLQHESGWDGGGNTLRAYRSAGRTGFAAPQPYPSGIVRISSVLEDGSSATTHLTFGGTSDPGEEERGVWEVSDDLRVSLSRGHQFRTGFLLQEESAGRLHPGSAGVFRFESLDDLANGRASSFSRRLAGPRTVAWRRYGAFYTGGQWTGGQGAGVVYGVRMETSVYSPRKSLTPTTAPLVDDEAARVPRDLSLSPRAAFAFRAARWRIEGGAGAFAGLQPLHQLVVRWSQLGEAYVILSCSGPAAPGAEWERYVHDPSSIPSGCTDGGSSFADVATPVTAFDPGYRAPRTWRATLSGRRGLTRNWGVTVDGAMIHGTNLPTTTDRNLRADQPFILQNEGGRPLFAAPDGIDPATGAVSPGAGRIVSALGAVEELGSRGESWTWQLGLRANGQLWRRYLATFSYTFTHARLLVGGIPGPGSTIATTAGDPRRLEWMRAPFTPEHDFVATFTGRPHLRLGVALIARLQSGFPYTPLVNADINGDGRVNDRAFIFAAHGESDRGAAEGIATLVRTGPAEVRRCLRESMGRIAAPDACSTPWSPHVDVYAEWTPWGRVNERRFVLGIELRNVPGAVDRLLHGPDNLKGWGDRRLPDPRLLEVRGFDPVRQVFLYDPNPRFGRSLAGAGAPFRVVLQGRFTVGDDPRYQPLTRAIELSRGSTRESIRAELLERMRNVPAVVLQLDARDTLVLALSSSQRAYLQAAADALAPRIAAAGDSLTAAFSTPGDARVVRIRIQDASSLATRIQNDAIDRSRVILTPAQWALLPRWLTRPMDPAELQTPPMFHMSAP